MRPLARSLLLGLDQAPFTSARLPVASRAPEPQWRCWLEAGAQALYLQAGVVALAGVAPAASAPPDPRPTMPQDLGPVLSLALQRADAVVLSELQAGLSRHGLAVSAGSLPALLSVPPALRQWAWPLLGPVGCWLAAQRDVWGWALLPQGTQEPRPPAELHQAFDQGTLPERLSALHALRERDPHAARELLLQSFETDPAPERLSLLGALETRLALHDEPMLMELLGGDRSKKVQAQAGELLLRLPGSAHTQRLIQLALPMVQLEGHGLVLTLPESTQGFPGLPNRARPKMGARASFLVEVLCRLPLSLWEQHMGVSASRILTAARPDEDMAALTGWTLAAARTQDSEWAAQLYRWWRQASGDGYPREALPMLQLLVPVLPLAQRVELAESMLRQSRRADPGVAAAVLQALPTPWPQPVAAAWLHAVAYAQSPRDLAKWLASTIPLASGALPVEMLPQGPLMPGSSAASVFKFSTRVLARRRIQSLLG